MKNSKFIFLKNVFLMLIILFGLWTSLHYTFCAWGPNTDQSFTAMLWYGINHFGLSFIKSVNFTQDNWLFSLTPIFFILFDLFGVNPYVIVAVGWLIFVTCAFLVGYIVKKDTGNRLLALIAVVVSLFVGIYNNSASFFVYSDTHNISMLWVLVDLIIILSAFSSNHKKHFFYFLILVVSFIAEFSDPWFNSAFSLPAIISLLVFGYKNNKYKKQSTYLIISIAISLVLSYTKVLGLLSFIPSGHFTFVSSLHQLKQNFYYYFVSVSSFFNIVQAFEINILFGVIFSILSFYIVLVFFKKMAAEYNSIKITISQKFSIYFAISSSLIITTVFLLSDFPDSYSSRFLYNVFYCILLLFAIGFSIVSLKMKEKSLMTVYLVFFILIGVAKNSSCWMNPGVEIKDIGVNNLIEVLEKNDLHFGYGDYFSTQANSIAVMTGNKITVVGMTDTFKPHTQASKFYFELNKIPKENYYFIVIPNNKTFEWHSSLDESLKNAELIFGKPIKIISLKQNTILIWDHPLDFANRKKVFFTTHLSRTRKFLYHLLQKYPYFSKIIQLLIRMLH